MVTQTPLLSLVLAATTAASLPVLAQAGVRDYAQLGQPCMQRYDAEAQVYKDISSMWKRSDKCQPGLVQNSTSTSQDTFALTCFVAPNDTGMDPRSGSMDLEGTCLKASCVGISSNNQDILKPNSERVTICHRTENEMNPWVRMTIDKTAWLDSSNDCGFTTEDYIVKEHGSIASIQDQMDKGLIQDFTTTQEYWDYWDRACPFVRQSPEHPHRCCQGPDCCGEAATLASTTTSTFTSTNQQEPDSPAASSSFERKLQAEGCPAAPEEDYTQDIYISFMGTAGQASMNLDQRLADAGTSAAAIANELKNVYNTYASYGQCVFFQRIIESVSLDIAAPMVPAMNKQYLLNGFRVKATISGKCNGCGNHLFLPTDSCRDTQSTYCAACIPDGQEVGEIIQIAGKDLYPLLNANLGLTGKASEIFRIQGDVDGEETCLLGQQKYLEATGEVVCL